MIVTELYNGQGLGNQLWSYVVTRTLALDRGFDFGVMHPEKFKGSAFLDMDFGKQVIGGAGPEGGPPACRRALRITSKKDTCTAYRRLMGLR